MRRRGRRVFALSVGMAVAIPALVAAIVLLLADGYLRGGASAQVVGGEEQYKSPENRCAQRELGRLERNGGIPMDPRTGHGEAADAILSQCAGDPGRVAAEGLGGGEPQGQP